MTYSIVARDPESGDLGVAVQSHFFGAGGVVNWAEAGVGAVATQSVLDVSYGPRGLDLMRVGIAADAALAQLVKADQLQQVRQVAMVDAKGTVAAHTGSGCISQAGHRHGHQVSAQANIMEQDSVWGAMIDAYEGAAGQDLAERLLVALEAAEVEGGDVRGQQSAAVLVVSGVRSDAPWDQKKVDLRVDDSDAPLAELRRLIEVNRDAERLKGVLFGGLLFEPSLDANDPKFVSALEDLEAAQKGLGANREPTFWSAVLLAKAGKVDAARIRLALAVETNQGWKILLQRIAGAGVLPGDSPLLDCD